MKKTRIICPAVEFSNRHRIEGVLKQIEQWICSEELKKLIRLFDGEINYNTDINNILKQLVEFSDVWDYRKIQKATATTKENEAARWLLNNDAFIEQNSEIILNSSEKLGFIDVTAPIYGKYDYIIALGGARFTNLHRCMQASKVVEDKKLNEATVIALGGMRPIAESERYAVDTYAPHAETEFEAMHEGMKKAFHTLNDVKYSEELHNDDNINFSWCIRKYDDTDLCKDIYLIAAPSTDGSRRANSMDSYKFFFERFKPEKGSRILFCTSSIYVNFQHIRFLPYAIEYGIQSDMIGVDDSIAPGFGLSKPVNYLQEIRATLMAMEAFVEKYQQYL